MQVRRAQARDTAAIQALYEALVPGDRNIAVDPTLVTRLATDDDNHLLVVEVDGDVCGTAFVTICPDPMYGFEPYALIENVIVREPARGRGVGRALLGEVERVARSARCTKLMLLSAAWRHSAHTFFERLGFNGERKRGFVKYLNR